MQGICKYDYIGDFINGIAIIRKNNFYGAILSGGRELIRPIYDYLSNFENGYSKAIKNGITIIVDLSGREYIETSQGLFEIPRDVYCIQECGSDLYRFAIEIERSSYSISPKLKWGVMNGNYEVLIKPEFDYIHDYVHNTSKACKITSNYYNDTVEWFIITNKSNIEQETFEKEPEILGEDEIILTRIIPNFSNNDYTSICKKYFTVRTNSLGSAVVYYNGQRYLLNNDVYRVFPLTYGHYIVQDKSGKFGAVDRCGKIVAPLKYQSASSVLYPHIISLPTGKEISLPKEITKIYSFEDEHAKFRTEKGMGLLNHYGSIIAKDIPYFIVSYDRKFNTFLLQRTKNNKDWVGLIDPKNGRMIKPNYNSICSYDDNGTVVEINNIGKFYLNKSGQCTILYNGCKVPLPKNFAAGFNPICNISIVIENDLFGLYDIKFNKIVVACDYQQIEYNEGGFFIAKKTSLWQNNRNCEKRPDIGQNSYDLFDNCGNKILSDFESIELISNKRFIVCNNGLYGLFNDRKEALIQCDNISIKNIGCDRLVVVNENEELKILDLDGNLVTEKFSSLYPNIEICPYENNKIAKIKWLKYLGYIDINGNLVYPYKKTFMPIPVEYDWCFKFNGKTFQCLKSFSDIEILKESFRYHYEVGSKVQKDGTVLIYIDGKLQSPPIEVKKVIHTSKYFSIVGIEPPLDEMEYCDFYYGVLDKSGKWLCEPAAYLEFSCLSKDFLVVDKFGDKALINPQKGIITDFKFKSVELAADNKTIISPCIENVFSVSEKKQTCVILLDQYLNVLFCMDDALISEQIKLNDTSYFFVVKNRKSGQKGVVNNLGKMIIPVEFSRINQFDKVTFEVELSFENRGLIDFNGKLIVPIKYKGIIKNSTDSYIGIE